MCADSVATIYRTISGSKIYCEDWYKERRIIEWIMFVPGNDGKKRRVADTANQKCVHCTVNLFPTQRLKEKRKRHLPFPGLFELVSGAVCEM